MSNNFFKSSLDQVFAELLKQSGGPPPLPEEIGVVSPWDEDVGEDKPIGLMTKEDLANFIRGLDEQTFNELKSILDKIEMPEADDLDEEVEEVLGPEKTVDEAMKELPQNERSEFLNKLRLSKAHKLSNRKIAMTEEEYLQSVPENMKETFKAMSDKEKAFLLNLPLNVEDPNGLAFVELKHLIQEREADTNTPEEFWREVVRISTEMVKDLDSQFTGPRFADDSDDTKTNDDKLFSPLPPDIERLIAKLPWVDQSRMLKYFEDRQDIRHNNPLKLDPNKKITTISEETPGSTLFLIQTALLRIAQIIRGVGNERSYLNQVHSILVEIKKRLH